MTSVGRMVSAVAGAEERLTDMQGALIGWTGETRPASYSKTACPHDSQKSRASPPSMYECASVGPTLEPPCAPSRDAPR